MDGTWWLPTSPDRNCVGTLSLDSEKLSLTLDGSIEPDSEVGLSSGMPELSVTPIIHGRERRGGKYVTLFRAEGANFVGSNVLESNYRAQFGLIGDDACVDSFTEVRITFDCLEAWTLPPPLADRIKDSGDFTLHFGSKDLAEAQVEDASVRLITKAIGSVSGEAIDLKRRVIFVIRFERATASDILGTWVRPLQDLLVLATGRPVRITGLYLQPVGSDDSLRMVYSAVQPEPGRGTKWNDLRAYGSLALLTFYDSPLSFEQLMQAWFPLRERMREVLVLLHAPHYAKSMFNEHRYAATFQSAEALADVLGYSGRDVNRQAHKIRVRAIVEAATNAGVSEEDVSWAERVLRSRNDKPLARQIEDLVSSTPVLGEAIIGAIPNFGAIATAARTGVSHGGAATAVDAEGRHRLLEVIRWVVRCRLLTELGIDPVEVGNRVSARANYTFSLEKLQEALVSK